MKYVQAIVSKNGGTIHVPHRAPRREVKRELGKVVRFMRARFGSHEIRATADRLTQTITIIPSALVPRGTASAFFREALALVRPHRRRSN